MTVTVRGKCSVLFLMCLAGCSGSAVSESVSQQPVQVGPKLTRVGPKSPAAWTAYQVNVDDHVIDAYVIHDDQPKPVLIIIHGSGCAPLVTADSDGALHDTTLFQQAFPSLSKTLHIAIIDKRGVSPLRFTEGMDRQEKSRAFTRAEAACSAEYIRHVTKQERVADVLAVANALTHEPWARQILLAGHSEGTHVVTGVLAAPGHVTLTAAGLFASAGPTPFFGGYVARGVDDRARFHTIFNRMRTLQAADDDFMYEGLPARRWKTFWLQTTSLEDIRESTVPLFVVQGSSDGTSLLGDLFALEAVRQQPTRSLRYVVVERGSHVFETPDGTSHVTALLDEFVHWGLDEHRETGVAETH
jgi:pimeloyl-ACP methyl ester carboxylesterase